LLHRPLTAISADEDLTDPVRAGFADLSERLTNRLAERGDFPGHTATATATATTPTLRWTAPELDKRCSSILMRAPPDFWLMILPYSSSIVSCTTERITHRGGAFIEGHRFIRQLSRADFEAAHLFVPFVGILTKTLPGLGDEFTTEQTKCSSWDMSERKNRRACAFSTSVAVAVASVEHVTNFEAHGIARTPASETNTHGNPHSPSAFSALALHGAEDEDTSINQHDCACLWSEWHT
jgi:hypothetical protein